MGDDAMCQSEYVLIDEVYLGQTYHEDRLHVTSEAIEFRKPAAYGSKLRRAGGGGGSLGRAIDDTGSAMTWCEGQLRSIGSSFLL